MPGHCPRAGLSGRFGAASSSFSMGRELWRREGSTDLFCRWSSWWGGAEEGGAGWGGVPAHGVAARAYSMPSNTVHCLWETGSPGGIGVLCMLLASWRPVSNIPGMASRSTMRAVTLASVAMLTPRESAKATDQSPVFLESLFYRRAAGLGIPLRITPPSLSPWQAIHTWF